MIPFKRILLGFDGSDGALDAAELTRVLAPPHAKPIVVIVFPYGPLPVSFVALQDKAKRDAEPLVAEARRRLPGREIETGIFGGGSPAWVLSHVAEDEDADLIVVGSPHRGPVGRVLIGSVAENLLHGASCPVAVAPSGFAATKHEAPRLIAVAYDGSAESLLALKRAEELALETGCALRILTVVGPPQVVPGSGGYVPVAPPSPEEVLDRGKRAVSSDVAVDVQGLEGVPAATLARACEDDVDLLVVGSRGYGPVMRVFLGSVSRELARIAPCPLLVIPRGG